MNTPAEVVITALSILNFVGLLTVGAYARSVSSEAKQIPRAPHAPHVPLLAEGTDGKPWAVLPYRTSNCGSGGDPRCPFCEHLAPKSVDPNLSYLLRREPDQTKPGPSWPVSVWVKIKTAPKQDDAGDAGDAEPRAEREPDEIETYRKVTAVRTVRETDSHEAQLLRQVCQSCGAGWYRLPAAVKTLDAKLL